MNGEDETRFSRQAPLLGEEGMRSLTSSTVFLHGLGGVGLEIAKNLVLTGVGKVLLHDESLLEVGDLSSQFFASYKDIGKNKAEVCVDKLQELNEHTRIEIYTGTLDNLWNMPQPPSVVATVNHTLNESLVNLNSLCRKNKTPLIVVEVWGLCGLIVSDFGSAFHYLNSSGKEYLDVPIAHTEKHAQDEDTVVITAGENLDTSVDGIVPNCWVKLSCADNEELNGKLGKVLDLLAETVDDKIISRQFTVELPGIRNKSSRNGRATRVFVMSDGSHDTIKAFISSPHSYPRDPAKTHAIMGIKTLAKFIEQEKRLPTPHSQRDTDLFVEIAKMNFVDVHVDLEPPIRFDTAMLGRVVNTLRGNLCPMAAIFGGLAAQEVLKACTGRYSPISPFFCMNALDWLYDPHATDIPLKGSRYDGQIAILGEAVQNTLGKLQVFVVGAGAVGCELLKNMATMGIACGPNGTLHLTDVDDIALSNLHRQFLYRKEHISQQKSEVAATVIKKLNPQINVKAYTALLSESTLELFGGDVFLEGLDVLVPAVDNIEAREFVDVLGSFYAKPMFDSGTEGLSGTTQVILPSGTVRYLGGTVNPIQAAVGCYEKSFPYLSEHTILIALGRFKELFEDIPKNVIYDTQPNILEPTETTEDFPHYKWTLSQFYRLQEFSKQPTLVEKSVRAWLEEVFTQYFVSNMTDIRERYPETHVRVINGIEEPFWNSKVHRPRPLQYQVDDETCKQFIDTGYCLLQKLFAGGKITPLEFEKDEISHVDFVYSISCLLCDCYAIPRPQRYKVRYIAGRMSIAIISSTAIVAGMTCLNLLRWAIDTSPQNNATSLPVSLSPKSYRNISFNTARNDTTITSLLPSTTPPFVEVSADINHPVYQLISSIAALVPYVLFYPKPAKTNQNDDKWLELWRHKDNGGNCNGAPPPDMTLLDALEYIHKKFRLPNKFHQGKYLRLMCEKEDCDTVVVKVVLTKN